MALWGFLIFFSHTPRVLLPSELKYLTNDGSDALHPLPPRAQPQSLTIDSGIDLSVVVPCYNETQRLGKMLDECVEHLLKTKPAAFEIIIVDDCSSDGTARYALEKASELGLEPHVLRVIRLERNRGKGGAVAHGMLHARGKYALFADADGATRFSDVDQLYTAIEAKNASSKIAIGSRAHMVNTDVVVKRSFIRNFLMYGLHTLVYVFGIRGVKDTQCGFKMYSQDASRRVFSHMHTERWIFDVETLLLAEIQDIPVCEVPVNWQEIDGSKVNLAKDSIDMAIDLVVMRLAYLVGVYKLDQCGRVSKKID